MLQDPLLKASSMFYTIEMYKTCTALHQRTAHFLSFIQCHPHHNFYEMLTSCFQYPPPNIPAPKQLNISHLGDYVETVMSPLPFLMGPELWMGGIAPLS